MKKTLHFISHTHWDREWFMSFERFRMKLVELIDSLLDTLDHNPDFKSFHMDGQIIPIIDYLEIKPQNYEKIKKYINEGRIFVGPWYILQDAYLISAESNVRNMLIGIRETKKFGEPIMLGYYPDTFGNISQTAQILNGFGIDNAVFGRGLGSVAAANTVENEKEELNSEIIWEAPDGSSVIGIYLSNWYHNAMEIPAGKQDAVIRIKQARKNAEKFALTPHLLMMNGCDHEPIQVNLPTILKDVQDEFDDVLLHSNFSDYLDSIRPYKESFKTYKGELYGQYSNGQYMLLNTASSRMYLKQTNHFAQLLLEKCVEPIGVISWLNGDLYRQDYLYKAWKILLENHTHDSICGCSVDMVANDMMHRYQRVIDIAEELLDRGKRSICNKIDTSFAKEGEVPFVVFNPLLWDANEQVSVLLDYEETDDIKAENIEIKDINGNKLASRVTELGRTFKYIFPDDAFRQYVFCKRFKVEFIASNINSLGYRLFVASKKIELCKENHEIIVTENGAENSLIKLVINKNGSFCVTDKKTKKVYDNLNCFEDTGDTGEEYNYVQTMDGIAVLSDKDCTNTVSIIENDAYGVTFKVSYIMEIPTGVTDLYEQQKSERTKEKKPMTIDTFITLKPSSKRIDIKTIINNQCENHRVRAMFYADIKTDISFADGHFDVLTRDNKAAKCYLNPSNCNRQQAFFELFDGEKGILVANRGLPEYEILPNQNNAMALTLLRCIGQIGDWGDFQVPGAQCIGKYEFDYSVIPYGCNEEREEAYKQAYQFNILPLQTQQTAIKNGDMPSEYSLITSNNPQIMMSALKKCEDRESVILRVYNRTDELQQVTLKPNLKFNKAYLVNLNEDRQESLHHLELNIPKKKIVTIEFSLLEKLA
jgi:alpha-mannosidase